MYPGVHACVSLYVLDFKPPSFRPLNNVATAAMTTMNVMKQYNQ